MVVLWKACPWQRLTSASMNHGIYLVMTHDYSIFSLYIYIYLSGYFVDQGGWIYFLADKSIINLADQEWYFFCPRDLKYKKKSRLCNRKTKAGYWKLTCKIKPIMAGHTKKNIGVMKTLTFYKTARPKDVRTGWMIYEFDIVTNSSLSKKVNSWLK